MALVKLRIKYIDSTLPPDLHGEQSVNQETREQVCGLPLLCKKKGFVAQKHDGVRKLLASLMNDSMNDLM